MFNESSYLRARLLPFWGIRSEQAEVDGLVLNYEFFINLIKCMQTKQAIQTSANVIRITSITTGDVYKRFDESYDDRTYYGVVKAVHNDGEKCIIEAIEYSYKYGDLDVEHKIMRGEKEYILFPSSPDELNLELEKARKKKVREIEDAKEKIEKNERLLKDIDGLISGETLKNLTAMSYKEMTQEQFNERKQLI